MICVFSRIALLSTRAAIMQTQSSSVSTRRWRSSQCLNNTSLHVSFSSFSAICLMDYYTLMYRHNQVFAAVVRSVVCIPAGIPHPAVYEFRQARRPLSLPSSGMPPFGQRVRDGLLGIHPSPSHCPDISIDIFIMSGTRRHTFVTGVGISTGDQGGTNVGNFIVRNLGNVGNFIRLDVVIKDIIKITTFPTNRRPQRGGWDNLL